MGHHTPKTNLLESTLRELKEHELTPDDVVFVRGVNRQDDTNWCCRWGVFAQQAKRIWFDGGYGSQLINRHLMVVGHGWWLERGEYDGSEWWEFKRLPGCDMPLVNTLTPLHLIDDEFMLDKTDETRWGLRVDPEVME